MKSSQRGFLLAWLSCTVSSASILPTTHLESQAVQGFQNYVARFDKEVALPFAKSGTMRIDGGCCLGKRDFDAGKPILEQRESAEIKGGSIHHYTAMIRVENASIANVRRVMQDYANYQKYFQGDVVKASGRVLSDSTPADEHFKASMTLAEATAWMSVAYDCVYDTHYRQFDSNHWASISTADSIKEWRDPKDGSKGSYPEGDDHGFMWKTNTYWLIRERSGGIDMQLESMTLSRPVPFGFGSWGSRRTRDAVSKMMRDMKAAVQAQH